MGGLGGHPDPEIGMPFGPHFHQFRVGPSPGSAAGTEDILKTELFETGDARRRHDCHVISLPESSSIINPTRRTTRLFFFFVHDIKFNYMLGVEYRTLQHV